MSVRSRLVTAVAIAALFGVPAAWLLHDVRGRDFAFPAGSSMDTSGEGALLARQYLERRAEARSFPPAGMLAGDLESTEVPANAVLFRLMPVPTKLAEMLEEIEEEMRRQAEEEEREEKNAKPPSDAPPPSEDDASGEKPEAEAPLAAPPRSALLALANDEATLRFVHAGGRLVAGLAGEGSGVVPVTLEPGKRWERVHPSWPQVTALEPPVDRAFEAGALPGAHALFASGSRAAIVRVPFGRGEIVALACPEVLLNDRLAKADHLALLEALAGEGRPVLFDEHVHGAEADAGIMELLRRAGLGPLVVFAALALAALAWRAAVRVGPPEDPHRERRSEATDFVDSVALLHERALSRRESLALYRRALEQEAFLREGLRGERLTRRVTQLAGEPPSPSRTLDVGDKEFQLVLGRLNAAFRSFERERRRTDRARP